MVLNTAQNPPEYPYECHDKPASAKRIPPAQTTPISHGHAGSILLDTEGKTDHTRRLLKSRHIQLIGIGGSIGTVLFVQIGQGLLNGGPGSLFIAFCFWCTVVLAVTMCMAEMVSFLPISSPFIRFAGRYVDEAFGFAVGWNFFVLQASIVPFEITVCNLIIDFWTNKVPTAAMITILIVVYAIINFAAVKWYGETEFWAALGKVLLIVCLVFFTFIVMLGGNPEHDRLGFRYWSNPGAFAEFPKLPFKGGLGRWLGFFQCLILAAFTIAGPEYVSMAAGEAENPRKELPRAFKAVFYRLTAFYMLGSLCVGILVPYNSRDLAEAYQTGAPGAAASPYVVAMKRLSIPIVPHLVNAAIFTSAFSAGNSFIYCASRSLYGLALEGKAPRILTTCTKNGIPAYCVLVVLCISLISFLQLSSGASVVLNWLIALGTASQLLNLSAACVSYLCFRRATIAQGMDRSTLPYQALLMPYAAWYALGWTLVMALVGGYIVFVPGKWNVPNFLFSYTMVFVFPVLYLGYKHVKKTKIHKPMEVDLVKDLAEVEEHEANYIDQKAE